MEPFSSLHYQLGCPIDHSWYLQRANAGSAAPFIYKYDQLCYILVVHT